MSWTRGKAREPKSTKESVTVQGHRGRVIEKRVRCSRKGCSKCPHGPYKYLVVREENRVRTIYLGKAE